MKVRKKTIWRGLVLLALAVLAAGLIAPYLSVNRLARQVRLSLEAALGRRVELGEVHLNLFNGPGFSISKVVIHEDPRISLEPLAYIDSLEARVNLWSLWTGRLEFSNLRLNQPSLNLAKPPTGPWNFEPLLGPTVAAAPPQLPRFPDIQLRGGRINFKFGDVKSVYYITNPDVDISPPSAQDGYWLIRFSLEPARTDRSGRGFARFSGRGRWRPDPSTRGHLDLSLQLDNSPVAELITLLHGHDIGVHGRVSLRAGLSGPASAIQITGRAEFRDIHRWDLLPPHGESWPLDYRGRLDLVSQHLELETFSPADAAPPLALRVHVSDYLSQPRWGVLATFHQFPLAPLAGVARHMGVALPEGLAAEGDLVGVISYSPETGLQGKLACQEASVSVPDSAGFRLQRAEVIVDRARLRLLPAALRVAGNDRATLQVDYSQATQALELGLHSGSMSIRGLRSAAGALLGRVPLLEHCRDGSWQGRLNYRSRGGRPGEWSGIFEIAGARVDVPGLAEPLEVKHARAALRDGGAVVDRLQARAGGAEFQGEYRYLAKAARPHQVRLSIPKLEAAELERILAPTLRRREGLLARTLGLGRARIPPWLAERHAEGALRIGSLKLGELEVNELRAQLRWDAAEAEIDEIEGLFADGLLNGRLTVDLTRAAPVYRLAAELRSVAWSAGRWEAEGSLSSEGTGADLWRNVTAEGFFTGRSVELGADAALESVSGSFQLAVTRGVPRLRLIDLEADFGEEILRGQGSTQDDGRLHLELSDGGRQVRGIATLFPFELVWQRPGNPR